MIVSDNVIDFIGVYENALPDEVCDQLVQTADLVIDREGVYRNNPKHQRDDKAFSLHTTMIHHRDLYDQEEIRKLDECVTEKTMEYIKEFPVFENDLKNYHIKFQRTEPTQGYHVWHSENSSPTYKGRDLVWTVYLNDIEEGGETEFLYQRRRVSAKKGSVLIFPASFTHTHRGNPPLSGVKYIATGWWTTIEE